jgi:hypothetical protein
MIDRQPDAGDEEQGGAVPVPARQSAPSDQADDLTKYIKVWFFLFFFFPRQSWLSVI